jgi:hypothetical protein
VCGGSTQHHSSITLFPIIPLRSNGSELCHIPSTARTRNILIRINVDVLLILAISVVEALESLVVNLIPRRIRLPVIEAKEPSPFPQHIPFSHCHAISTIHFYPFHLSPTPHRENRVTILRALWNLFVVAIPPLRLDIEGLVAVTMREGLGIRLPPIHVVDVYAGLARTAVRPDLCVAGPLCAVLCVVSERLSMKDGKWEMGCCDMAIGASRARVRAYRRPCGMMKSILRRSPN